jgi:hypothetical protein
MTDDIVQTNEYSEVNTEIVPVDTSASSISTYEALTAEPNVSTTPSASATESSEEAWRSVQAKTTEYFANATSYATTFFHNNRQLLTTLGWIFLAFLGARLLFAALDAIDDIPLVTPILKLIGLVYAVRFVWRYLIRENDRRELMETLSRTKREMFGSQS